MVVDNLVLKMTSQENPALKNFIFNETLKCLVDLRM